MLNIYDKDVTYDLISLFFYIASFYLLSDITWLEFLGVLCFTLGVLITRHSNSVTINKRRQK